MKKREGRVTLLHAKKKTLCCGDSGAPVLLKNDRGEWMVVGIISSVRGKINGKVVFGADLCDKNIDHSFVAYTDFSQLHAWINEILAGDTIDPAGGTVFSLIRDMKSIWYRLFLWRPFQSLFRLFR